MSEEKKINTRDNIEYLNIYFHMKLIVVKKFPIYYTNFPLSKNVKKKIIKFSCVSHGIYICNTRFTTK